MFRGQSRHGVISRSPRVPRLFTAQPPVRFGQQVGVAAFQTELDPPVVLFANFRRVITFSRESRLRRLTLFESLQYYNNSFPCLQKSPDHDNCNFSKFKIFLNFLKFLKIACKIISIIIMNINQFLLRLYNIICLYSKSI